ncbi:MAG: DUF2163 domain-containing protein [Hyphomonas sp.]
MSMGGVFTTCLCWRLMRRDGAELRVTDHDRDVTVAGEVFLAGAAVEGAQFTASTDLKPGRADAAGGLSHDAIRETDLASGVWNGARVDVMRVDWRSADVRAHVWSGRFSDVRLTGERFEVSLVSLKDALERPVGRVFARRCDAALGDARCGVDVAAFDGVSCDQRYATCVSVFGNGENFRGFPHMPTPDFVLRGPARSGNDGGKR